MSKVKRDLDRRFIIGLWFVSLAAISVTFAFSISLWLQDDHTRTIDDALVIYDGGDHSVRALAFSPDSSLLASAHADGHIRLWDTTTFELAHDLYTPPIHPCEYDVRSVEFSADGSKLVVARGEGIIHILEVPTGEPLMTIDTTLVTRHESCRMTDARLSSDGTTILASGDLAGLWDATTGELINVLDWGIVRVAFHPSGKWLAYGAHESGSFALADVATQEILGDVTIHDDSLGCCYLYDLEFSPTGEMIAAAFSKGWFYVVDVTSLPDSISEPAVGRFDGDATYPSEALEIAFSPAGDLVAVSGHTYFIEVWSITRDDEGLSLHEQVHLKGHPWTTSCLAFSLDGRWLASGGEEGTIRLWEMNDIQW